MGAGITWKVRVLRLVEDEVEAYGVTSTEAMDAASREPGVARVLDAYFDEASDITQEKWDYVLRQTYPR
jgi:hypothetical protein